MIKLVTFDLWDTILSSDNISLCTNWRVNKMKDYLIDKKINIEEQKIRDGFDLTWEYFKTEWLNNSYTPHPMDLTEYLLRNIGIFEECKEDKEKLCEILASSVLEETPSLVKHASETIKELSLKYKLAIVSDTGFAGGKYLRKVLEKYDLLKYFSSFAFSDEIGVSKPDIKMFNYVLSNLQIKPEDSIHIGDMAETDIEGAKNAGMYAVQFVGNVNRDISSKADFVIEDIIELKEKIKNIEERMVL